MRRGLPGLGHLRRPHVEQRQLRCVRSGLSGVRSALLARVLRHPVRFADQRMCRGRRRRNWRPGGCVRRPSEQQRQLWVLRRELRRQSHVHRQLVRLQPAVHGLLRHLHEPGVGQQQLRLLRHELRERDDVPGGGLPMKEGGRDGGITPPIEPSNGPDGRQVSPNRSSKLNRA